MKVMVHGEVVIDLGGSIENFGLNCYEYHHVIDIDHSVLVDIEPQEQLAGSQGQHLAGAVDFVHPVREARAAKYDFKGRLDRSTIT